MKERREAEQRLGAEFSSGPVPYGKTYRYFARRRAPPARDPAKYTRLFIKGHLAEELVRFAGGETERVEYLAGFQKRLDETACGGGLVYRGQERNELSRVFFELFESVAQGQMAQGPFRVDIG